MELTSNLCDENSELSLDAERQSARAEAEAESAGLGVARAGVEQLRRDAEGASEQTGVGAVEAGKARERRESVRARGVGERDLILLREVGLVLPLGARERVDQFAVAGGIASGRGAICGVLASRF